jgi:hypothetical protein
MKIAFVGASGYGNVGDDAYTSVFRQQLAEHEVIIFNSDIPDVMPEGIDLLVLGGGGILYSHSPPGATSPGSPHFENMRFYMDWAMEHAVPWGISSCGFQFDPGDDRKQNYGPTLEPWRPYLKQARFITVRSPRCVQLAQMLTGRTDVEFFPDACYLLKPAEPVKSDRPMVTVVPACSIRADVILTERMTRFCRASGHEVVWLSMGSPKDDNRALDEARRLHPQERIMAHPTPDEALAQIAASRFVLTGRYHGMVFARSSGVPFYFPEEIPYKLKSEDFSVPYEGASGHFTRLRQVIAELERSGSATEPALPC